VEVSLLVFTFLGVGVGYSVFVFPPTAKPVRRRMRGVTRKKHTYTAQTATQLCRERKKRASKMHGGCGRKEESRKKKKGCGIRDSRNLFLCCFVTACGRGRT
jgi:Flp pilus assembly protein TadB